MFYKAVSVVFCFEEEMTMKKLLAMEESMGASEFGNYISKLIEKDFYEEIIEEKVQSRVNNVSNLASNDVLNELLDKVNRLIDNGVPVSQITPPKPEIKVARAGDNSVARDLPVESIKPTVNATKKNKKKMGGLRNKDILSKMESMTK